MDTPSVPANFVPATSGEVIDLGRGVTCRIMEDGTRTGLPKFFPVVYLCFLNNPSFFVADNRIAAVEFVIPAESQGPPPHWHEMHDETFLVTAGTIRFHLKDGKHIDAKAGDYLTVPPRSPHSFSNPFGEEARFFNTYTPAYYINYFKMLGQWVKEGVKLDVSHAKTAMAHFATLGIEGPL